MENNPVMKELWQGFATLVGAFFRTTAKSGLAITILVIANVGFILWIDNLNAERRRERIEFKNEVAELRADYKADISSLRTVVDSLRNGLEDCNEARVRAEAQSAALLQIIKGKKLK